MLRSSNSSDVVAHSSSPENERERIRVPPGARFLIAAWQQRPFYGENFQHEVLTHIRRSSAFPWWTLMPHSLASTIPIVHTSHERRPYRDNLKKQPKNYLKFYLFTIKLKMLLKSKYNDLSGLPEFSSFSEEALDAWRSEKGLFQRVKFCYHTQLACLDETIKV